MGKLDTQDHLNHFNDLMELYLVSNMAKCRVLNVTLISGAKKWLKLKTPGSIASWQLLSMSFLRQFVVPLAHLENVKQRRVRP